MEFDIENVTGEAVALDLATLKSQLLAEMKAQLEADRRLNERLTYERSLRTSALSDPRGARQ